MGFGSDSDGDSDDMYGETVKSTPTLEGTKGKDSAFGQAIGEARTDEQIETDRNYNEALANESPTFVDGKGVTHDTLNYEGRESSAPPGGGKFGEGMSVSLGPAELATGVLNIVAGPKIGAASFLLGQVGAAVDRAMGNPAAVSVGVDKGGNVVTGGSLLGALSTTPPGPPTSLTPTTSTMGAATGGSSFVAGEDGRAPSAPRSGPPSLVDNVLQDNNMLDSSRSLLNRGIY